MATSNSGTKKPGGTSERPIAAPRASSAALGNLVRLLARQAAREFIQSMQELDGGPNHDQAH